MPRLTGIAALAALLLCGAGPPHDPDGRIRAITRRIEQHPNDAMLLVRRSELHRQIGHLVHAMRDLDQAARIAPGLPAIDFARARTLLDAGRRPAALAALDRFLQRSPRNGQAVLLRARMLLGMGQRQAAVRSYQRALELTPRPSPEHFLELAMALCRDGEAGRARARTVLRRGIAELGAPASLRTFAERLGIDVGGIDVGAPAPLAHAATAAPVAPLPPTEHIGEVALVAFGSLWKYLDDGSNQGTAWVAPNFNDSAWRSGPSELGYGDNDERTLLSYGNDPQNKHVTSYFRQAFDVPDGVAIARARLLVVRDDGIVVHLNGRELVRDNMPTGAINHTTLASSEVRFGHEADLNTFPIDPALLKPGRNVLAVEIHQFTGQSTDISFNLELRVSDGVTIVDRGPYLQQGGPDRAILRWRTDAPTATVAFLGNQANNLRPVVQNNTRTTEHTAVLTGLKPGTAYFYAVGSQQGILAGGPDYRFTTAPPPGTNKKTRIWAIGDSGTATASAAAVRNAYLAHTGSTPTDIWLMLGDNAYMFGTDPEYQRAVFDMYPRLLRSTFLWPTIGNHDTLAAYSPLQIGPYYDIFTLPKNAEVGGVASGTEAYYSFDHGDIHFICLNSSDEPRIASGAMLTWLRADLAATTARWVIAYWHHPPYSKGSHDSDNVLENEMIEMRQNVLPLLEAAGVDLILSGHSHSYERSYLLDGHYGFSSSFKPSMMIDQGDGRPDGHGLYAKPTRRRGAHEGTVYVVAGCSGLTSGGLLDHRAMVVSLDQLGSMVIDIDGDRLEARFLTDTGATKDSFTIVKGLKRTLTRDTATVSIATGGSQILSLEAGKAHAGRRYLVAGSFGTAPGFRIGSVQVPLNPDVWFQATLDNANSAVFQNTLGVLDFNGSARARLSLPPVKAPSVIGLRLHHAFVAFDRSGVRMASNPVSLTVVK